MLQDHVNELKGLSHWEIQRMINQKGDDMMSTIRESNAFMKIVQEDHAAFKYKLDHISLE